VRDIKAAINGTQKGYTNTSIVDLPMAQRTIRSLF
jgi:hypothetical protein